MALRPSVVLGGLVGLGLLAGLAKKSGATPAATDDSGAPATIPNLDEAFVTWKPGPVSFFGATPANIRTTSAVPVIQKREGGFLSSADIVHLPMNAMQAAPGWSSFYIDSGDALLKDGDPRSLSGFPFTKFGALLVYKPSPYRYVLAYVTDPALATKMATDGPWAFSGLQGPPAPAATPPAPATHGIAYR